MKKEEPKLGRLILALMLAASCMQALSTESVDEDKNHGSIHVSPTGIATATVNSYTTPATTGDTAETPSSEAEAVVEPEAMQVPPSAITVAHTASDDVTPPDPVESIPAGEEELTFFDKVWGYLWADEESVKAKALFMKKKHDIKKEYGDAAILEPTLSTILRIEEDSRYADVVREQKQLALEVEEAERLQLYHDSLECLTLNGFREARKETADQEVATAAAVLNRLSVGFRKATTICEVIYTPKQFSWVEQHGRDMPDLSNPIEKQAWNRSLLIATRMMDPDATYIDPSNGAIYYYNREYVMETTGKDWKYAYAYKQVAVLGNHRFMAEKDKSHPYYIDNRQVRINPVLFNGLSHNERNLLIKEYQAGK
jgi:spore germination cell wall hydrolase CwlJ-like protein